MINAHRGMYTKTLYIDRLVYVPCCCIFHLSLMCTHKKNSTHFDPVKKILSLSIQKGLVIENKLDTKLRISCKGVYKSVFKNYVEK